MCCKCYYGERDKVHFVIHQPHGHKSITKNATLRERKKKEMQNIRCSQVQAVPPMTPHLRCHPNPLVLGVVGGAVLSPCHAGVIQ